MGTITARVDEDIHAKLEKLAQATQRSRSWLVADAVRRYVSEEAWQIDAIEEGVRQAEAGEFATPQEVKKAFARWGVNV